MVKLNSESDSGPIPVAYKKENDLNSDSVKVKHIHYRAFQIKGLI